MRLLIVYNTRTNFTKKIAKELAQKLGADIEEIVDLKNRQGALAYLVAGKDATGKRLTEIKSINKNPKDYDFILIGSPVWVGTMTPAIRTFLRQEKENIKKFACFVTQGGKNRQKVFEEINKETTEESVANVFFVTKEIAQEKYSEKLDEFARRIKSFL